MQVTQQFVGDRHRFACTCGSYAQHLKRKQKPVVVGDILALFIAWDTD